MVGSYAAFLKLLREARERVPMRLSAYCLMAVVRGRDWLRRVNEPQREAELEALRKCVRGGRPFGSASWQRGTADG